MRQLADAERIGRFMAALGAEADSDGACYFTGGATAVEINVELASPADFLPVPQGWEDRSTFVTREGRLSFYHFDLLAQTLAKLERGHSQDLADVQAMVERGLVDPARAIAYFEQIEPQLYRFPAVDPPALRQRIENALG